MTSLRIFAVTHTGSVRRVNEDSYGATNVSVSRVDGEVVSAVAAEKPFLAVVADGLGGHPCGDVASQLAVDFLLSIRPKDASSLLADVHRANRAIVSAMNYERGSVGMGTTIAGVLVHDGGFTIVNVGDSAVYAFDDDRLMQLSKDDVPVGQARHPWLPSSVVTQTLGGARECIEIEPHLFEWDRGAPRWLLLCTDGLTNFVPRDLIADALRNINGEDVLRALLQLALAAGGLDNITCLLIEEVAG